MMVNAGTDLRSLRKQPFDLLQEMERRGKVALAGAVGDDINVDEWVGIGFRMGDEQFIVARDDIKEILLVPSIVTRVPGAKPWMRGLANVRGHLMPVVDLRIYLGGGLKSVTRDSRILVVNSSDLPVGIIVDEVFGFRRFLEREYSVKAPQTDARCERYLDGAYQRGNENWPLLSMNLLLKSEEFQSAAEQKAT
jgi:twitching motility protein PilI